MRAPGARPVFVERRVYRTRRLMDAARLLPVLGALLFLVPVLWSDGGDLAGRAGYLFAVWGLLVGAAAVLSRVLRPRDGGASDTSGREDRKDEL